METHKPRLKLEVTQATSHSLIAVMMQNKYLVHRSNTTRPYMDVINIFPFKK